MPVTLGSVAKGGTSEWRKLSIWRNPGRAGAGKPNLKVEIWKSQLHSQQRCCPSRHPSPEHWGCRESSELMRKVALQLTGQPARFKEETAGAQKG